MNHTEISRIVAALRVAHDLIDVQLDALALQADEDAAIERGVELASVSADLERIIGALEAGESIAARAEPDQAVQQAFHTEVAEELALRAETGPTVDDLELVEAIGEVVAEYAMPADLWRSMVCLAAEIELRRQAAAWAAAGTAIDRARAETRH